MPKPPPFSPRQDNFTHHSSPTPGNVQTPAPVNIPVKPMRQVSGTVRKHTVPMHITKHPNPVGRPKTPRY